MSAIGPVRLVGDPIQPIGGPIWTVIGPAGTRQLARLWIVPAGQLVRSGPGRQWRAREIRGTADDVSYA